MEVKAKWDGPTLLVERKVEDGPKLVDRYESGDGTRLLITREIELPRGQKLEVVLVYDRSGDQLPSPAQGPGPPSYADASALARLALCGEFPLAASAA